MRHSTGRPTAAQSRRMALLAQLPCWCCWPLRQPNRTQVHHIVDRGYRIHSGGHWATLPLCAWHHMGILPPRPKMKIARAAEFYGPSLALSKRAWVDTYGTEREVLAKVNDLLGRYDHGGDHLDPTRFLWPGHLRIGSALVVVEYLESIRFADHVVRFPR